MRGGRDVLPDLGDHRRRRQPRRPEGLGRPGDRDDARLPGHDLRPADRRRPQPCALVRPGPRGPRIRRHRSLRLGLYGRPRNRCACCGAGLHLRVHDPRQEGCAGDGAGRVRSPAMDEGALIRARTFEGARKATLALVEPLDDAVMEAPLAPIMSPLVWDLAHIAAYEDLWAVHRLGGEPLLHPDLAATYDAFETPRAVRGEIQLLNRQQALGYMEDVRTRTLDVLDRVGPNELHDLVIFHELQHTETMRQALFLGGQAGGAPGSLPTHAGEPEWIQFDAGEFQMGAEPHGGFVYDNELPRHAVTTGAFAIQSFPVTNASS